MFRQRLKEKINGNTYDTATSSKIAEAARRTTTACHSDLWPAFFDLAARLDATDLQN
jgi:hypothetical protein